MQREVGGKPPFPTGALIDRQTAPQIDRQCHVGGLTLLLPLRRAFLVPQSTQWPAHSRGSWGVAHHFFPTLTPSFRGAVTLPGLERRPQWTPEDLKGLLVSN